MKIDDFIGSLTRRGSLSKASENTKRAYRVSLLKFESFLNGQKVRVALAQEFILQEMQDGLKPASVCRDGWALKRYLAWVGFPEKAIRNVRLPSVIEQLPDYHEKEELDLLLKVAKTPLERALVIVLTDTVLRISELRALTNERVDWKGGYIFTDREKTGMPGWIPISPQALAALTEYVKWAKIPKSPKAKLFPMSYNDYYKWIRGLGERAGIKSHPHKFRHTGIALRHFDGVEISTLKDLAGHKKYDTTMRYAGLKSRALKEKIKPVL